MKIILAIGLNLLVSSLACAELVGRWAGDGNTLDTAGTNHAALVNGATYADGRVNQAFSLDGANDYVALPGATSLLVSNDSGTITAWVNPSAIGDNDIVVAFGSGSAGEGIGIGIYSTVRIYHHTGTYDWQSRTPVSRNAWTLLAYTWDASTESIYTNGVLSESRSRGAFTYVPGNARIGHGWWGDGANNFPGKIDQIMVFNECLNSQAIHSLASTTPASFNALSFSNGAVTLGITNITEGLDNRVLRTSSLVTGTWSNVVEFVGRSQSTNLTDTAAHLRRAFYRIETQ